MKFPESRKFGVLLLSGLLSAGLVACAEEEPEAQVFEEEELGMDDEEDLEDEFGTDSEFEGSEPLEEFPSEPLGEEEVPLEPDIGE